MRLTPEELAARKRRNLWLAAALVAFMVLVFTTTLLRMHHNSQEARADRAARVASVAQPDGQAEAPATSLAPAPTAP